MLWIYKSVTNIEEAVKIVAVLLSKYCQCLQCFVIKTKKVFKGFASVAKTLKMLVVLRSLQNVAHTLKCCKFAVPS